MLKKHQRKVIELGLIRCPKCRNFTCQTLYSNVYQNMFLGFAYGPKSEEYFTICERCKAQSFVDIHRYQSLIDASKKRISQEKQKKLWSSIRRVHKNLSVDKNAPQELKPFFELVRSEVKKGLQEEISEADFNYVFTAYLTNLTNATKKVEE